MNECEQFFVKEEPMESDCDDPLATLTDNKD